ncbi:DNA-binding response regulator, OmpR family, contains REC and winged-helix (wHTH) domain [Rhizobium sp. AN5]|nr:DNA-binding response regulator, OmpR family, contains REC and winged-helix (wHTH) domain [Rhizobium sp. AN5]
MSPVVQADVFWISVHNCSSITRPHLLRRNTAATFLADKEGAKGRWQMRLLLIEDEKEMADALSTTLGKQGIVIDHTMRLGDAMELARQHVYDAILLDRRLPDGEGLTFIPKLRRAGIDTPIILLTAMNEPEERIEGLNGGADDYLGKPFLVGELLARLRAVLRRPASIAPSQISAGRIVIDPLHLSVTINSLPFDLPRRELMVLITLAKRKGKSVLRSTLEAAVYNYEEEIQSNALDAHISRLRKRLLDASAGVSVHNIRGIGYLLREDT